MDRMLAHSAHGGTGNTSRLAELACASALFEGGYARFERRVAHEQFL